MSTALITNSLIRSAERILRVPESFSMQGFFDLSTWCEAIVLFDSLKVIEASNQVPSPILEFLCGGQPVVEISRLSAPLSGYEEFVNRMPTFLEELSTNPFKWNSNVCGVDIDQIAPLYEILPKDEVRLLLQQVCRAIEGEPLWRGIAWVTYVWQLPSPPEGACIASAYVRRSIGYLWCAVHEQIDFFPDFHRVPYVGIYADMMHRELSRELYDKLCIALSIDLDQIQRDTKSIIMPIPPITALVLREAASLNDVPKSLQALRNQFSSFRKAAQQVDKKIQQADTIHDKLKAINKKKQLFEELSKEHRNHEAISYKGVLSFAEKLVKPITNLGNPSSYSTALLLQPIEWLKSWWLRRPLIPLFRIDRKIRHFSEYDSLIKKHWGSSAQELAREDIALHGFSNHAAGIQRLFDTI